jgi:hypothetical protein
MLNPRDIYLRTCSSAKIDPLEDYFSHGYPLEIGTNEKKKITELKKVLTGKSNKKHILKAYALFQNWSSRIFIEGMLLFYTHDEIASIPSMDPNTVLAYRDYFFSSSEIESLSEKAAFINLISSPDAERWFQQCSTRNIDDIAYRLTGKPKERGIQETLSRIFHKMALTCESFMTVTPDSLQGYENGLTAAQKSLFDIGLKAGDLSHKIATTLLKEDDGNKDDLLSALNLDVAMGTPDAFDIDMGDMEESLRDQMEDISPLKAADED